MGKRDFDAMMMVGSKTGTTVEAAAAVVVVDGDRISRLPTRVLRRILFHLPLMDEARTCVLSKSWYVLVSSSSPQYSFNFTQPRLLPNTGTMEECQGKFINHVEESFRKLRGERFVIASLRIAIVAPFNDNMFLSLDSWIALAAHHRVRMLSLRLNSSSSTRNYRRVACYKFPDEIALASTVPLKVLTLKECKLQQNSLCDDHMDEPLALKELRFDSVVVENRDGMFQNFVSRCNSLEYLKMLNCLGIRNLYICNHSKLNKLDIDVGEEQDQDEIHEGFEVDSDLDIDVSEEQDQNERREQVGSLLDLDINVDEEQNQNERLERVVVDSLFDLKTVRVTGVPERPLIVKATRCRNLQHLYLTSTKMEGRLLENLVTDFPLLQTLSLHSCTGIDDICVVVRHPLLETLELVRNSLVDLAIETPKLRSFHYAESSIPKTLFLSNAPSYTSLLDESTLLLFVVNSTITTAWFLQLRAFLAQLNKHNVHLSLYFTSCTHEFNPDEFRSIPKDDLPYDVEQVEIDLEESSTNCAALFDGLFWSCRPREVAVTCNAPGLYDNKLSKAVHEYAASVLKGDPGCCNSCDVKCWRHFLKGVSINGINILETGLLKRMLRAQDDYGGYKFGLSWL